MTTRLAGLVVPLLATACGAFGGDGGSVPPPPVSNPDPADSGLPPITGLPERDNGFDATAVRFWP